MVKASLLFVLIRCRKIPNKCSTFLHGLDETSKDALKACLCRVVRMVRSLLGRLLSELSALPRLPAVLADSSSSSSSLLPGEKSGLQKKKNIHVKVNVRKKHLQTKSCIFNLN